MHYQPISLPLCKPPDNETIALRNQVDSKIMKQAFDWMKPEMDTISQNRRSLIDTFLKKIWWVIVVHKFEQTLCEQ
jgi:hypothetical protein